VRWVSETIVKPAALSNEVAAAFVSSKQTIFDRVAEFADSIKEQIVLKQVVSNINDQSGQKVNEIKMVLKPENLGSVYIKLEHINGEIKGTIQVTNDSVKDTLKASLPELKAALSNIGMTVNNFDITMANSNTGSDFQGGQGRNNFSQWQAAAQQVAAENTDSGVDSFVNADGYLNYLA
jgi:flagellar hook-length control protein FliK